MAQIVCTVWKWHLSKYQVCNGTRYFKVTMKKVKQNDSVWNTVQKMKLLHWIKIITKLLLIIVGIYGIICESMFFIKKIQIKQKNNVNFLMKIKAQKVKLLYWSKKKMSKLLLIIVGIYQIICASMFFIKKVHIKQKSNVNFLMKIKAHIHPKNDLGQCNSIQNCCNETKISI